MDQHELITDILRTAGGSPAETAVPKGYSGKIADIVFEAEGVIVEVKSLTSDRRRDPRVSEKLGEIFVREAAHGGPVPFGTITVGLHDLPRPLAEKSLRVVGARVRREVSNAAEQIAATRAALDLPEAYGLVIFVSPPDRIGHQSVTWLVNDALVQRGSHKGLDGAMVVETALGLGQPPAGSRSFSVLYSISGKPFPDGLGEKIARAWAERTGQPPRPANSEAFVSLGASE